MISHQQIDVVSTLAARCCYARSARLCSLFVAVSFRAACQRFSSAIMTSSSEDGEMYHARQRVECHKSRASPISPKRDVADRHLRVQASGRTAKATLRIREMLKSRMHGRMRICTDIVVGRQQAGDRSERE